MSQSPEAMVYSDSAKEKHDAYYGPMTSATYPLLYASILDVQRGKKASPWERLQDDFTFAPNIHKMPEVAVDPTVGFGKRLRRSTIDFSDHSLPEDEIEQMRQEVVAGLQAANISYFIARKSAHGALAQRGDHDVAGDDIAATHFTACAYRKAELSVYESAYSRVAHAVKSLNGKRSFTSKVLHQLNIAHPEVHQMFALEYARKTLVDGYFSTLEAAIVLNQANTKVSRGQTRRNLQEILRSDVPTELTKKLRASTLTALGMIGLFPEHILMRTDEGLKLHPDMLEFLKVVNQVVEDNMLEVKPMVCPFAVSLNNRVDNALAYYQTLPQEVERLLREKASETGIKTVGQVIAELI